MRCHTMASGLDKYKDYNNKPHTPLWMRSKVSKWEVIINYNKPIVNNKYNPKNISWIKSTGNGWEGYVINKYDPQPLLWMISKMKDWEECDFL